MYNYTYVKGFSMSLVYLKKRKTMSHMSMNAFHFGIRKRNVRIARVHVLASLIQHLAR